MGIVLTTLQALSMTAVLLAASPQGASPTPPPAGTAQPPAAPSSQDIVWPVSLDRIQEAISRPSAIKSMDGRPVFRVEIQAKKPTIEDILGPDYLQGPAPALSTSHQEFLNMVTPPEFRGMGAFTGGEAVAVAATSIGLQWALMKAIDSLKKAGNARAKAAARREVDEALKKLAEARRKAGLPPK